jgi:hypothetical protein
VEFNNGLLFSKHALKENEIFEIRVDRKIGSWSGSLAIGVTTANPNHMREREREREDITRRREDMKFISFVSNKHKLLITNAHVY